MREGGIGEVVGFLEVVDCWKVNFAAEDDEPTFDPYGSENNTIGSPAVSGLSFPRLEDQPGGCGTGGIATNDPHV